MKPRNFTEKNWRIEDASGTTRHGLEVFVEAATNKVSLRSGDSGADCGISIPRPIFNKILDWLEANANTKEAQQSFGKRVGRQRELEVVIASTVINGKSKIVSMPSEVHIRIYQGNIDFHVFARLGDWRQIIQWYNSDIKPERAAKAA